MIMLGLRYHGLLLLLLCFQQKSEDIGLKNIKIVIIPVKVYILSQAIFFLRGKGDANGSHWQTPSWSQVPWPLHVIAALQKATY